MTPEQRQRQYAANAARKRERNAARRADEAGRLVLCPVCDGWFGSWRAQATHERLAHGAAS